MENKIKDYYKNIDNPVINNYINNINFKNILELSTITDLYVFKKEKKNQWKLKDKRQLLKECEYEKKKQLRKLQHN